MSLCALRRNITRSILTCLGIVIAAVIAMMELGGGSSKSTCYLLFFPARDSNYPNPAKPEPRQ